MGAKRMFGRSNCRNMFQNAYGNGKNLILKKEKGWKEIYEEDTMERIVRPIELIARRRKEEKEKNSVVHAQKSD